MLVTQKGYINDSSQHAPVLAHPSGKRAEAMSTKPGRQTGILLKTGWPTPRVRPQFSQALVGYKLLCGRPAVNEEIHSLHPILHDNRVILRGNLLFELVWGPKTMDNQSQVRVSGDTTTDKRMNGGHVKQFRQQVAHVRKGQRSETPHQYYKFGNLQLLGRW